MDSGELLRLRDRLLELAAQPAWQDLMELLDGQLAHAERVSRNVERWQPRGLDGLIQHQAREGHTVGFLKGLTEIRYVVDRVQRMAAEVERALDETG